MTRLALGLVLITLPFTEIVLLIKIGQQIGFWTILAIIVATAVLGGLVLVQQRFAVLRGMLEALAEGHAPVRPILEGVFLALAGLLLISPGLIADCAGLLLLVPPIRQGVGRWSVERLLRRLSVRATAFRGRESRGQDGAPRADAGGQEGPIIEGEFERLGERTVEPRKGKGPESS